MAGSTRLLSGAVVVGISLVAGGRFDVVLNVEVVTWEELEIEFVKVVEGAFEVIVGSEEVLDVVLARAESVVVDENPEEAIC